MRKILLATTAVAAAAVFGAAPLAAQEAPTVRVGGYFRFNYAFTDQDGVSTPAANLGKSDFASDMEIHVIVQGKAANGVSYGATIEVQDDFNRQATPGVSSKNQLDTDEMYVWVSSPQAGQLRFGDEDGVVLGALATGWITSFGTGGIDGDWLDNVVGGNNRPSYFVGGGLNDSTKIIYTSPQFFGFDFGASFGFNDGEGEDSGCEAVGANCDRYDSSIASAYTLRRKNEVQAAVRYRGSFGGVGIAGLAGYIGSGATKNTTGLSGEGLSVGVFGLQATAYGFTAGANYAFGRSNAGLGLLAQGPGLDDRDMRQWVAGVAYTISNLTVGANFFDVRSAGNQNNPNKRKDQAWSVGANYNLAPGLALVAEYTQGTKEENASNAARTNGVDTEAKVFILGTRIAF
ncbi:porin [Roseomonas sp. M0104]|uniref:Porin n=1 Tax=Teichococcus coralli TaxID=2545983 RepID=A0A845BH22_9PROT|nr:porin [Pseudoroseomonas coralli]MXP64627.1 porin [Pseudoroseomonas coralli]